MNSFRMNHLMVLAMALIVTGCAGGRKIPSEVTTQAKMTSFTEQSKAAFEMGWELAPRDDSFVDAIEENTLAAGLYHFYDPFAGARRHLDFFEKQPNHPLRSVYLNKQESGLAFSFQKDELFQSGNFFRNYEIALFRPVFRQVLLQYASKTSTAEAEMAPLMLALKEAIRLSPRLGQEYPNDLKPRTHKALTDYIALYPEGPIADRFRFLKLWSERNGAWRKKRAKVDDRLTAMMEQTQDELLKLEIKDALNAPHMDPQSAFTLSFFVPGLGQINQGDLQGGLILGGLSAAAWVWLVSKLILANDSSDATTRDAARGDAALAGGLVAFSHLFTAYNAHEQARFYNIVIEWDSLNRPRLRR